MPTASRNSPLRSEKMGGEAGGTLKIDASRSGARKKKGPYDRVVEA